MGYTAIQNMYHARLLAAAFGKSPVTVRTLANRDGLRLDRPAHGALSFADALRIVAVWTLTDEHAVSVRAAVDLVNDHFALFGAVDLRLFEGSPIYFPVLVAHRMAPGDQRAEAYASRLLYVAALIEKGLVQGPASLTLDLGDLATKVQVAMSRPGICELREELGDPGRNQGPDRLE